MTSTLNWNFASLAYGGILETIASAKAKFYLARDLDTLRFRADSRINEINRAATPSGDGVELVDADEILSERSANGIIGC